MHQVSVMTIAIGAVWSAYFIIANMPPSEKLLLRTPPWPDDEPIDELDVEDGSITASCLVTKIQTGFPFPCFDLTSNTADSSKTRQVNRPALIANGVAFAVVLFAIFTLERAIAKLTTISATFYGVGFLITVCGGLVAACKIRQSQFSNSYLTFVFFLPVVVSLILRFFNR